MQAPAVRAGVVACARHTGTCEHTASPGPAGVPESLLRLDWAVGALVVDSRLSRLHQAVVEALPPACAAKTLDWVPCALQVAGLHPDRIQVLSYLLGGGCPCEWRGPPAAVRELDRGGSASPACVCARSGRSPRQRVGALLCGVDECVLSAPPASATPALGGAPGRATVVCGHCLCSGVVAAQNSASCGC